MRKVLIILLTSNLIAIFTYMGISVLMLTFFLIFDPYGFYASWKKLTLPELVFQVLILGFYTFVSLGLCFLVGRKLLKSTGNIFLNGLSVVTVVIFINIALYISSIDNSSYMVWFTVPIGPISLTIESLTGIEIIYIAIAMSPLPFIAMWMGIMSKKYSKRKKV